MLSGTEAGCQSCTNCIIRSVRIEPRPPVSRSRCRTTEKLRFINGAPWSAGPCPRLSFILPRQPTGRGDFRPKSSIANSTQHVEKSAIAQEPRTQSADVEQHLLRARLFANAVLSVAGNRYAVESRGTDRLGRESTLPAARYCEEKRKAGSRSRTPWSAGPCPRLSFILPRQPTGRGDARPKSSIAQSTQHVEEYAIAQEPRKQSAGVDHRLLLARLFANAVLSVASNRIADVARGTDRLGRESTLPAARYCEEKRKAGSRSRTPWTVSVQPARCAVRCGTSARW